MKTKKKGNITQEYSVENHRKTYFMLFNNHLLLITLNSSADITATFYHHWWSPHNSN